MVTLEDPLYYVRVCVGFPRWVDCRIYDADIGVRGSKSCFKTPSSSYSLSELEKRGDEVAFWGKVLTTDEWRDEIESENPITDEIFCLSATHFLNISSPKYFGIIFNRTRENTQALENFDSDCLIVALRSFDYLNMDQYRSLLYLAAENGTNIETPYSRYVAIVSLRHVSTVESTIVLYDIEKYDENEYYRNAAIESRRFIQSVD